MGTLHVELVSPDRRLWSGDASMVIARNTEGDIGVLPGHVDHLSALDDGGVVEIRQSSGSVTAAVHGGFLLVHDDSVRILAEVAELGPEIDVQRAERARERAAREHDEASAAALRRAEARLRAAGQH